MELGQQNEQAALLKLYIDFILKKSYSNAYHTEEFYELCDQEKIADQRLKNEIKKQKHAYDLAARHSNEAMNLSGIFFCFSTAGMALASFFLPAISALNAASQILNLTWNYSDSFCSSLVTVDLMKKKHRGEGIITGVGALLLVVVTTDYVLSNYSNIHYLISNISNLVANISLGALFSALMLTCAIIEIFHVYKSNQEINQLKINLDEKMQTYQSNKSDQLKAEIHALTNELYLKKQQVALHEKNAVLWTASATLILISTLMTLGVIGLSGISFGAVPAAIGVVCGIVAIARWYINRSTPTLTLPVTKLTEEPDTEKINAVKNKNIGWFSLFKTTLPEPSTATKTLKTQSYA